MADVVAFYAVKWRCLDHEVITSELDVPVPESWTPGILEQSARVAFKQWTVFRSCGKVSQLTRIAPMVEAKWPEDSPWLLRGGDCYQSDGSVLLHEAQELYLFPFSQVVIR